MIAWFFYILFFTIPLAVYPYTSELFEFNKIVLLYIVTSSIIAAWAIRMIVAKRIVFKRTMLDIPLLIFLGTQAISTLLSIDFRTSLLGYYSRFNGGLVSSACYVILYWAFVSNTSRRDTQLAIRSLLLASVLVSFYGIAQHFGIDKDIWVQDVQSRVFSSLGQPNWLAAWIVAILPITWALAINLKCKVQNAKLQFKMQNSWIWIALSGLLFVTFLYTKSRSGALGLFVAFVLFWTFVFFKNWKLETGNWKLFLMLSSLFFVLCAIVGTPFTPNVRQLISNHQTPTTENRELTTVPQLSTQLEVGGSESSKIRRVVWKGATDIWKHYPVFGTGVETFAFAYYEFKPSEHNYVSEWDYLYNKAHNEYLNYLSTTGVVGLAAYVILIIFSIIQLFNLQFSITNFQTNPNLKINKFENSLKIENCKLIIWALLASYISILITNFFGFSVVPVSLLFFIFPAMAVTLVEQRTENIGHRKISTGQRIASTFVLLTLCYVLFATAKYWYADLLYAKGKYQNDLGDVVNAQKTLTKSTEISPNESIFWDELRNSDTQIAAALSENKKDDIAKQMAVAAISDSTRAVDLSPANVNLKRTRATMFVKLSLLDPNYLLQAHQTLIEAVKQAPTDPKLQYSLAGSFYRLGQLDQAIDEMRKAVDMKKDYTDSHYALALMYEDAKENDKAKIELKYILDHIEPNNEQVKKELEELESK